MPVRRVLINCPWCKRAIEDIKQEDMICRYCGKHFKRSEIVKESEEYLRKEMIIKLNAEIRTLRVTRLISLLLAPGLIILGLLFLFSEQFTTLQLLLSILLTLNGCGWLGYSLWSNIKLDKKRSKMFDLAGGRGGIEI